MKKLLIACTLLLSLGSISNTPVFAQQIKSTDADINNRDKVTTESFLNQVKQYEIADSKDLEQKSLDQILNSMRTAMINSKKAIEAANISQDDKQRDLAIKQQQTQGALYNKLISATKNESIEKTQITRILKEFSTTL